MIASSEWPGWLQSWATVLPLDTTSVKRNGPPIFINISVGGSLFSPDARYFLSNDSIHWSCISTIKYVQVTSFDLRITYLEPPEGWMYKSFNDVVWWGHQTFSFSSEEKVIPCEKFECKIHCGRIFVFVLVQIFKCFLLHSITIEQFVTRHSTLCKVPLNHPLSPCWNTKTLYFVNNKV